VNSRAGWIAAIIGVAAAAVGVAVVVKSKSTPAPVIVNLAPGTMPTQTMSVSGAITIAGPTGSTISDVSGGGQSLLNLSYGGSSVWITGAGTAGTETVSVTWTDASGAAQQSSIQITTQ
jgi:hypothetical protein